MTKEQMMDDVIRRYGFENKWTVWFCELAEALTESQLLNAYILLDANVLCDVENDEPDNIDDDFDECGYNPYMGCYDFDC